MKSLLLICVLVAWIPLALGSNKFKARDYRSMPDWLKTVVELPLQDYDDLDRPNFEVLLDEAWYELKPDGTLETKVVFAMRVLGKGGIRSAAARKSFFKETDRVKVFDCWLVDTVGEAAIRLRKTDALDKSTTSGSSLASSHRYMEHSVRSFAKVGQIFAYEVALEKRSVLGSMWWSFQAYEPVRRSRFNLKVPEGWGVLHWNCGVQEPETGEVDGWRFWQHQNLAPYERQELSLRTSGLFERMALTITPPEGSRLAEDFISVSSWEQMSELFYHKYRDRMVLSDEARQEASNTVAKAESRFEKAKLLGELAQSVNYTNISLNLGLGGGYIPRYSQDVHDVGWGDCKDKATYLCSLLETVGVKAYPVIVNGLPRHWVDPEIPSPSQFNHCITAIEADESFPDEVTIEVESLGRLLIFDATDPFTAFGDLSGNMHGTGAIILAPDHGGLAFMPRIEGELNVENREIKAELMPNGSVIGLLTSSSTGQSAMKYRIASVRNDAKSDLEKYLKEGLDDSLGGLKTVGFAYADDRSSGRFDFSLQFGASSYATRLDVDKMLFSPVLFDRQSVVILDKPDEERVQPIVLDAQHSIDRYEVFLPVGFAPLEIPEEVSLSTGFGEYSLDLVLEQDKLKVQRRLFVSSKPLAPELADEVEAFYRVVAESDKAVLSLEALPMNQ